MPALTGFDKKWVKVGVFLSRRRKEADSLVVRACPPPYVGGYASLFTLRFLYSYPVSYHTAPTHPRIKWIAPRAFPNTLVARNILQ